MSVASDSLYLSCLISSHMRGGKTCSGKEGLFEFHALLASMLYILIRPLQILNNAYWWLQVIVTIKVTRNGAIPIARFSKVHASFCEVYKCRSC